MAAASSSWSNSFWEFWNPIDTCLMGWCCPCVLFGKTQARVQDPELKEFSPINDNCLIWCGLNCCGASFVVQTLKRGEIREKYGITDAKLEPLLKMEPGDIKKKHNVEGSMVEDCLGAFCCPCCSLIQTEKEVVLRAGQTGSVEGYQKTEGMEMKGENVQS